MRSRNREKLSRKRLWKHIQIFTARDPKKCVIPGTSDTSVTRPPTLNETHC